MNGKLGKMLCDIYDKVLIVLISNSSNRSIKDKGVQQKVQNNKRYFTMAKIKVDNKYAFTFTNNAWNTHSGIKKRMLFYMCKYFSTFSFFAKIMRNRYSHICLELVCVNSISLQATWKNLFKCIVGIYQVHFQDLSSENHWTGTCR